MSIAIHQIPPAPRRPRWSAVLWFRWPLALAAFLLAVYGGLWTLMFWFSAGGKQRDDDRLDTGAHLATGTVTVVEPVDVRWRGELIDEVRYRFHRPDDAHELFGTCFAVRDTCGVGDTVDVEYDPTAPHKNRIVGGRLGFIGWLTRPSFFVTIVPGLGCFLLWLIGVLRLRHILRHGDIAVAQLVSVHRLRFVQPGMLEVRFRFKSRQADVVDGRHWVRERSRLGERVSRPPPQLAVAHDRHRPGLHRLVAPEYFETFPRVPVPNRIPKNL